MNGEEPISELGVEEDDWIDSQVKRLHIEKGDVVVIEYPSQMSSRYRALFELHWSHHFPEIKVIVLDDGMTLRCVLRKDIVTPIYEWVEKIHQGYTKGLIDTRIFLLLNRVGIIHRDFLPSGGFKLVPGSIGIRFKTTREFVEYLHSDEILGLRNLGEKTAQYLQKYFLGELEDG